MSHSKKQNRSQQSSQNSENSHNPLQRAALEVNQAQNQNSKNCKYTHARPQEFLAGAQFLFQPVCAVTGEKVENFLSDRQAVHPGKRLGVGA